MLPKAPSFPFKDPLRVPHLHKGTHNQSMAAENGVVYGQCQRNYAAKRGFHITDGCCEFTPGVHLPHHCLACGCHRNFHAKIFTLTDAATPEDDINPNVVPPLTAARNAPVIIPINNNNNNNNNNNATTDNGSAIIVDNGRGNGGDGCDGGDLSPQNDSPNKTRTASLQLAEAAIPEQELAPEAFRAGFPAASGAATPRKSKTRFTPQQISMMREFAESLGWKMTNREREPEVKRFCTASGVSRQTFRTWLNNNKKTYGCGSGSGPVPGAGSAGGSS